jgi:hypothetical protein
MTAQKGKDLLLKVDSTGTGSFATMGGLRARTLAFNAADGCGRRACPPALQEAALDQPQQLKHLLPPPFSNTFGWLITGGFAKGYRIQILGVVTALSAVATWAIGDGTLTDLIEKVPVIFGGLGLATLGMKVDAAKAVGPVAAKATKAK